MVRETILTGVLAVVLGVVIALLAAGIVAPLELPAVTLGVVVLVGVGSIGYLYTRASRPRLVRDGFYGIGIALMLMFTAANVGESGFILRVLLAMALGAFVAGIGFGVDRRWISAE